MKKYDNFVKALQNLEEITNYNEPYDTVTTTGLVGLYEICFEQAWKALKEFLEEQGFSESRTGSPRLVLKTAYSAGIINDEELWLDALQSRNNVAHAYNAAIALNIIKRAREDYLPLFEELNESMKEIRGIS